MILGQPGELIFQNKPSIPLDANATNPSDADVVARLLSAAEYAPWADPAYVQPTADDIAASAVRHALKQRALTAVANGQDTSFDPGETNVLSDAIRYIVTAAGPALLLMHGIAASYHKGIVQARLDLYNPITPLPDIDPSNRPPYQFAVAVVLGHALLADAMDQAIDDLQPGQP